MTRTNREMVQIFFSPKIVIIVSPKTLFSRVNSSMAGNGSNWMKDKCRIHGRILRSCRLRLRPFSDSGGESNIESGLQLDERPVPQPWAYFEEWQIEVVCDQMGCKF
ncbi:hypothetical protein Ccrd_015633 [Cynara cardunculus var. scolymus]|uniref:Uncharacterized protein n=1 Tax=Cynara cardunculus var. scolymus TaxID=59895 RepID=A0A103YBH9_CYNCS|nr:hypothetical protein Ccrd_015633 [Cynara cardunculus var. scolymus]